MGSERLSELYDKSCNVFNIKTQDKGTREKKVQLPLEHSGTTQAALSKSVHVPQGYYEDLNGVRLNNIKAT